MTESNLPLNSNTRTLRVSEDGFFTASGRTCDSCGLRSACAIPNRPGAIIPEKMVCDRFSPLIVFAPPLVGFEGFFNTFRLGASNYKRYKDKIGTVVTLYDKRKAGVILGYARITGVATGGFEELLQRYAHTNHQSIAFGKTKEDAADFLRPVLTRAYKSFAKTDDPATEPYSVIFAVRCSRPEAKAPIESLSVEDETQVRRTA